MYANVLVKYQVKSLDKTFTYHIPSSLEGKIKVGLKVKVPFANKIVGGIVLGVIKDKPDMDVKDIDSIDPFNLCLNDEQLKLGVYLKEQTLCTLMTAYETILPTSLKIKKESHNLEKYDFYYVLNEDKNFINEYIYTHKRNIAQINILNDLLSKDKINKNDYSYAALKSLLSKGFIKEEKVRSYRINKDAKKVDRIKMNEEQQKAFDAVDINVHNVYLLQGVTGSGKTLVYMELIDKVLKKGKSAIVLVPEICLTTQTVERFYNRFGEKVAVFHSGLSEGEKFDEYQKICDGKVSIVVGTRSSIFVPLNNLGIIIIDEEHSDTYKQDTNPRYDAIDIATYRAKLNNIPVILASATPSLESRARADKKVYKLLRLDHRVNDVLMPNINIVDMKQEAKKGNILFSDELITSIKCTLNLNKQVILLLNRRGFSTFISCKNCGFIYKCPNCDITLTFHKTSNNLRCHYCGYVIKKDDLCPECHEQSLNFLGIGTEKVEEELRKIFNNASIIRMDQDTTSKKGSYQRIIDDFAEHKYDILLGTQMISKGLDFKDVSLVGIINADTSLNIPDFRSAERTFSLLSQTAGRSGRSSMQGKVIIQTYNPDHKIFKYIKDNDYDHFYINEMNARHILKYPPYTFIVLIKISSVSYEDVSKHATIIKRKLEDNLGSNTTVYGPNPAPIFRINNIYTFQIIIKYTKDNNLKNLLKKLDEEYIDNSKVNLNIVFNPTRF